MRRHAWQLCELAAFVKNAGVPACALCQSVDQMDALLACDQEAQQKPSKEGCETRSQLNQELPSYRILVAPGDGAPSF